MFVDVELRAKPDVDPAIFNPMGKAFRWTKEVKSERAAYAFYNSVTKLLALPYGFEWNLTIERRRGPRRKTEMTFSKD